MKSCEVSAKIIYMCACTQENGKFLLLKINVLCIGIKFLAAKGFVDYSACFK